MTQAPVALAWRDLAALEKPMAPSGGRLRMSARSRIAAGLLIIILLATVILTAAASTIVDGDGMGMPLCPESPLCTSVHIQSADSGPIVDCYCVQPEAGIIRHVRRLPALRRARFAGVVRGSDADSDDYKEKTPSGGGRVLGLVGPIVNVPVSLRSAQSLQASPDGQVLNLTLASGTVLRFVRDSGSGELQY